MDIENIKLIIENNTNSSESVKNFIKKTEKIFNFNELDVNNLRQDLWTCLYKMVISTSDEQIQANCLSAIRILSRDKKSLYELVTENDWLGKIQSVCGLNDLNFEFTEKNEIVAIEAEKCLCNIVFNSMKIAKKCCDNGILFSLNERIRLSTDKPIPSEIRFFDMKLMFIITALCPQIRKTLRIEKNAVLHQTNTLQNILESSEGNISKMDLDLVSETLKALFNLTLHLDNNEDDIENINNLVKLLRSYLLINVENETDCLILQNNVINLLTNMPNQCYKELIPEVDTNKHGCDMEYKGHDVSSLKQILMLLNIKLGNDDKVSDQLEIISPIATVLYKGACAERIIRKYLRSEILPPLKDVHNRPEEGTTLRNGLCRLLTTPITQLRDIVAEFLFILCKKSVRRMIKYTGYGNAAGLFAQRGLLGGKEDEGADDFSSDSASSETEEYAENKHMIDPVLGCYKTPHQDPMKDMTDEQKEYEAMKLVQMMNDLTKSGTIKPCRVGKDGKPEPIEHVLQFQENVRNQEENESD